MWHDGNSKKYLNKKMASFLSWEKHLKSEFQFPNLKSDKNIISTS